MDREKDARQALARSRELAEASKGLMEYARLLLAESAAYNQRARKLIEEMKEEQR